MEDNAVLTDSQYRAVLDLYNELHSEFWRLSPAVINGFYDRLYARKD